MIFFDRVLGPVVKFGHVDVQAGKKFNLVQVAQVPFRPRRFIINCNDIEDFQIDSLVIANINQLLTGNSLPAQLFSRAASPGSLAFDTVPAGKEIIVTVTNTSKRTRTFFAEICGECRSEDLPSLEVI